MARLDAELLRERGAVSDVHLASHRRRTSYGSGDGLRQLDIRLERRRAALRLLGEALQPLEHFADVAEGLVAVGEVVGRVSALVATVQEPVESLLRALPVGPDDTARFDHLEVRV